MAYIVSVVQDIVIVIQYIAIRKVMIVLFGIPIVKGENYI